jgi:hypothetical protein
MRERCPGCGAEATYVGLNTIECQTSGCANYREPVIEARSEPAAEARVEPPGRTEAAQAIAQQTAEELLDSFAFF